MSNFPKYYKLGDGLIKNDGEVFWFVNWDSQWEASQELQARFIMGDLTSDPEPINEIEAGAVYQKITGKVMT